MIKGAVKRPILTFVVFLILIIIGTVSWKSLPIDIYPNIELPQISVLTIYPGAGSEDVEKQVTKPLEDVLSSVQNLKKLNSTSMENISVVTLTFEYGTDLTEAVNDVRDALDLAAITLPKDAERPKVIKFSSQMMPVIIASVRQTNPGVNLEKFIDEKITPMLMRVDGVGGVDVWGGVRKIQVKVKIDRVKMENLGIVFNQVIGALKANNLNLPSGTVNAMRKEVPVRLLAELENIEEVGNIVVGYAGRTPVYLRDIAEIKYEPEERLNYQRLNGKPSVIFAISKKSGANTVKVSNGVKKRIEELNKRLQGIEVHIIMDNADYIVSSIKNLSRTIGYAIILVMIVTFLMLNNLRASLIVASVIPVSLIVAFIFLFFSGGSLNIISLSAIAITIGMVVDNAIVVLENIFHHRERGEAKDEASIFGTQEVVQAITASTITTIVIFLPLFLVKGLVGVLFKQLAATVPIILGTSLLTSMSLTPMLSARFLRIKEQKGRIESFFKGLESKYRSMLEWSLRHKRAVVIIFIVFFIFGMFLFRFVDTEFMPVGDTGEITGNIALPLGTPLDVTNERMKSIEKIIQSIPEVRLYSVRVGRSESGFGAVMGRKESSSTAHFFVILKPLSERKRKTDEVAYEIQKRVKELPGIKEVNFEVSGGMNPMAMGEPVQVILYGEDLSVLDSVANSLKEKILKIRGVARAEVSLKKVNPELVFIPDRERMNSLGVTPFDVGDLLRSAIQGVEIGKLRKEGEEYEIFLSIDDNSRKDPSILTSLLIRTRTGKKIPLGVLGKVELRYGPFSIERKDNQRVVYIDVGVHGRSAAQVSQDIVNLLKSEELPIGVSYDIGGIVKDQAESFSTIFFAIILGMILVFLVMAAQFESFLDPFIIMFSVPFAIIGVSLIFFLTGVTMSLMGMVGMLMLIGIVVNNAIVLVDYTNLLRLRGRNVHEAVVEGSSRRLRPVLMTALTTIFGLLPLAIVRGEGAEMWAPLGISVIGGLLVSTFVTLILVPVLYSIFESRIRRRV